MLCVDDNVEVLQALRRQLRLGLDDATRVEVATDVPLALARLEAIAPKPGEAVIIVSDWLMPGLKGEDLVKAVSARCTSARGCARRAARAPSPPMASTAAAVPRMKAAR